MSAEDLEICCHLTPLSKIEQEDDSLPCDMFCFEFVAMFMKYRSHLELQSEEEDDDDDVDDLQLYDSDCDTLEFNFLLKRESLVLDEESCRSAIHSSLVGEGIPVRPFMIDRIVDGARRMAQDKCYMGRRVLHLGVSIELPPLDVDGDDHDDHDHDHNLRNDDDEMLNMVPASKSSIEALERVKVEGYARQCTICFEEVSIGSEATRMPCFHQFHSRCICGWLEKSRVCPLCRFELA